MTARTDTCGVPGTPGAPGPGPRKPGQWPHTPVIDQLLPRNRATHVRARHWALMSTAAAVLDDQPTPWLVREAAHRICTAVTALAEDIATALETPENNQ